MTRLTTRSVLMSAMLNTLPSTVSAQSVTPVTIAPIVRMAGRDIVACGVRFENAPDQGGFTAEFTLSDEGDERRFILRVRAVPPRTLTAIALETADASTATLLGNPVAEDDGTLAAFGTMPGLTGSEFVRSLMVGGGTLKIEVDGTNSLAIPLLGPFSQQVRASYINCAGDLKKQP